MTSVLLFKTDNKKNILTKKIAFSACFIIIGAFFFFGRNREYIITGLLLTQGAPILLIVLLNKRKREYLVYSDKLEIKKRKEINTYNFEDFDEVRFDYNANGTPQLSALGSAIKVSYLLTFKLKSGEKFGVGFEPSPYKLYQFFDCLERDGRAKIQFGKVHVGRWLNIDYNEGKQMLIDYVHQSKGS